MKVYLLMHYDYDDTRNCGVFASWEAARREIERQVEAIQLPGQVHSSYNQTPEQWRARRQNILRYNLEIEEVEVQS